MKKKYLFIVVYIFFGFNSYSKGDPDDILKSVKSFSKNCGEYHLKIKNCSSYKCEHYQYYREYPMNLTIVGMKGNKCITSSAIRNDSLKCQFPESKLEFLSEYYEIYKDSIDKAIKNSTRQSSIEVLEKIFGNQELVEVMSQYESLVSDKNICNVMNK